MLKLGTLFSGIGAPECAVKRVFDDVTEVFACEIDKFARESFLAIHSPKTFYGDITTVDFTPYKFEIDLLVGGSPCQSFSMAGKRGGFEDTRGTLFHEFARAVKECQPKYFLYENVKGVVSHDSGKTIETMLRTFGEFDYELNVFILNTKDFGVPQNRERLFIVGRRTGELSLEILSVKKPKLLRERLTTLINRLHNEGVLTKWVDFEIPKPRFLTKKLKDVLENDVDEKYYLDNKKYIDFVQDPIRQKKQIDGEVAITRTARQFANWNGTFIIQKPRGFNTGGVKAKDGVSPTLSSCSWERNNYLVRPKIIASRGRNKMNGKTEQQFEINHTGISNAITTVQKDNYLLENEYRIRKLTPKECWRLQDFPDDALHKAKAAGVSDSQLYKQAGNSMSVNVIEAIMRSISNA